MFLINGDFQKDNRICNSFIIQSNQISKIYFLKMVFQLMKKIVYLKIYEILDSNLDYLTEVIR